MKLWMWTHPSAHTQIVEALAEIFHLEKVCSSSELSGEAAGSEKELEDKEVKGDVKAEECKEEATVDDVSKKEGEAVPEKENEAAQDTKKDQKKKKIKKSKDVNAEKIQTRNVPFERTPKYVSGDGRTTMTLLKDTLNRFRLLGPKSYTVLSSAILPANIMKEEEEEVTKDCEEPKGQWWKQYFGEEERLQNHQKQVASWKQLASCAHPPAKVVLPLTVRDPRATLPTKKVPMEDEAFGNVCLSIYMCVYLLIYLFILPHGD